MAQITTRIGARQYIRRVLGEPVICLEMTDEQLDQIIEDTLMELYRYLFGEATIKDYIAVHLQGGQDTYIMPDEVMHVGKIFMDSALGNINMLFTPAHTVMYNDLLKMSKDITGRAYSLTNWYVNMSTIDNMQFLFEKHTSVIWSEWEHKAKIVPAPETDVIALFSVWKKVPEQALYNNDYFKKLIKAKTMQQWGLHMKKYTTTLPGGGSMNGSEIYSDGVTLEDKVIDQLKREQYMMMFEVA